MKRRTFINSGLTAGFLMAIPGGSFATDEVNINKNNGLPDLVGVINGTATEMFEKGIKELGGMGSFVKKGQIVVVKPNIGWNVTKDLGANTDPDLVGAIIKSAYASGAKKVYVFDNTCNNWKSCYKNSGIEEAVLKNGGFMMPGNHEENYKAVKIPGAKYLKDVKVHELYLDADVIINVPTLKHHGGARMTSAIKNLMGVVWDRRMWHKLDLQQCIGEFPLIRKPDLNIVDAYTVMMKNGPRGISKADVALKKMQILSRDMVAADSASAAIMEFESSYIPYIGIAAKLGLGIEDLSKLSIKRISL